MQNCCSTTINSTTTTVVEIDSNKWHLMWPLPPVAQLHPLRPWCRVDMPPQIFCYILSNEVGQVVYGVLHVLDAMGPQVNGHNSSLDGDKKRASWRQIWLVQPWRMRIWWMGVTTGSMPCLTSWTSLRTTCHRRPHTCRHLTTAPPAMMMQHRALRHHPVARPQTPRARTRLCDHPRITMHQRTVNLQED